MNGTKRLFWALDTALHQSRWSFGMTDSDEETFADRSDFGAIMSRCLGAEDTRPQMTFFVDPYHLIGRFVKRGGSAAFRLANRRRIGPK